MKSLQILIAVLSILNGFIQSALEDKQIGCTGRVDSKCQRCMQDTAHCVFCREGYFPKFGGCELLNRHKDCDGTKLEYCQTCNGVKCKECLFGFQLQNEGEKCISCYVKGCKICETTTKCEVCNEGYHKNRRGKCYKPDRILMGSNDSL